MTRVGQSLTGPKNIHYFSRVNVHFSGNIERIDLRKLSSICREESVMCPAVYGRIATREVLSSSACYKL
jgi:hypothetical protein